MKKKPSVLFISMGINEGATRFRVKQYLPYLKDDNFTVFNYPLHWGKKPLSSYYPALRMFFNSLVCLNKVVTIFFTPFFDVVFLQRPVIKFFSPFIEKIIRKLNKNIIFDFDDSIWLNYKDKDNPVDEVIKLSKQVIVGSKHLFDHSVKINSQTFVIPTPVETQFFKPPISTDVNNSNVVTIGWVGSSSNLEYLSKLEPVFKRLFVKYGSKVKLVIFCDRNIQSDLGIIKEFIEWEASKELEIIQKFNIGIMPLEDNEWTRGKCAFKAIQYMALGIPVVLSPVGANKDIRSGSGLAFANNEDEWFSALDRFISNKKSRKHGSCRLRKEVLERYSVAVNYKKVKSLILKTWLN